MKTNLSLILFLAITVYLSSCNNEEKVTPPMDISKMLVNYNTSTSKTIFSFDGMDIEIPIVQLDVLSVSNDNSNEIYEADMEMTLPTSIRTEINSYAFDSFKFKVKATSTEDYIAFSGDCMHDIGNVKLSIDGIYKETSIGWDTLRLNLKREPLQAAFAEKTFEMKLDENTLDLSEIADNDLSLDWWDQPYPMLYYANEGMAMYMNYLKNKTNDAIYRFTFHTDGTLDIQKKNTGKEYFEKLAGRFTYYLADDKIGFIEMEKKYATEIMQLLLANDNATPYGFFYPTYFFENIMNVPFCYKTNGNTLWLALGDQAGIINMNSILFTWRTNAKNYYNMDESDPLSFIYMGWNKKENHKDQIWWKLEEVK